jgi:hypothetical protein
MSGNLARFGIPRSGPRQQRNRLPNYPIIPQVSCSQYRLKNFSKSQRTFRTLPLAVMRSCNVERPQGASLFSLRWTSCWQPPAVLGTNCFRIASCDSFRHRWSTACVPPCCSMQEDWRQCASEARFASCTMRLLGYNGSSVPELPPGAELSAGPLPAGSAWRGTYSRARLRYLETRGS